MLKLDFDIIGYDGTDQTKNTILVRKKVTQLGEIPKNLLSKAFIELEMEDIPVTEIILNQNTFDIIKNIDATLSLNQQAIQDDNRLWTADYIIDNSLLDNEIKLIGEG